MDNVQLKKLIDAINTDENKQRKKDAWTAYQCLEDNQEAYVRERLEYLYPMTHAKFRIGDISVVKKVIDKKNKAYKTPPIRTLATKQQTKALEEVYNKNNFNHAFAMADKYLNLYKYVALWLTYVNPQENSEELEGEFYLHALAPFQYDIVLDEITKKPVMFIMSYPSTDITGGSDFKNEIIADSEADINSEVTKYSIWTATEFIRVWVDETNNIIKTDLRTNELGVVPVGFLSYGDTSEYPPANNLHKQAIEWNVELSDLKTAAATQGHGQLVIEAPEGKQQKTYHMGMHTSIVLPQSRKEGTPPTKAYYINASPDLAGQLSVLKFDLSGILDSQGITSSSVISGGVDDVKSGFDRLLKEADVQDIVEYNQNLYANVLEPTIYKILQAYDSALNLARFTSPDITITFEKPKVLISDKETLDNIEKREELGLLLPWEKHILINPNLTEAEAKKKEEEIQAYKAEQAKAMQDAFNMNNEDDNQDDEGANE